MPDIDCVLDGFTRTFYRLDDFCFYNILYVYCLSIL